MKKIALSLLCGVLFMGISAEAESVSVAEGQRTVKVTEFADAGTEGMLLVAKKDQSVSNNENVYAVEYAVADENGEIEFIFDMTDERNAEVTDGEYNLYIRIGQADATKKVFTYATVHARELLVDAIDRGSSADEIKETIEAVENAAAIKAVGGRLDIYQAITDDEEKLDVAGMLYKYLQEMGAGEEEIEIGFNLSLAALKINKGDEADVISALEIADITFEEKAFSEFQDTDIKEWIVSVMKEQKPYASAKEFEEEYKKAIMLFCINNARVDEYKELFELYAEALEIDENSSYKKYNKLSSKIKANEKIYAALKKKSAATPEALCEVIADALKAIDSGSSDGGSSSSSNSSKSSSSPGMSIGIPVGKGDTEDVKNEPFKDLEDAKWATEAITRMAALKMVSGDGNGNFRPNDKIKREEFVRLLVEAVGVLDEAAECDFVDVPKDSWFYKYVASAYKAGLVSGISESEFGVGANLTRQDMAVWQTCCR